jgi:hypothetical protein
VLERKGREEGRKGRKKERRREEGREGGRDHKKIKRKALARKYNMTGHIVPHSTGDGIHSLYYLSHASSPFLL